MHAFPPFEGEPFDGARDLSGFSWPVVLFSGGRDTREPASLHREMSLRLPDALHVVFPNAAHDLLRFRTKAVLEIERATVCGGLPKAARVAEEAVADSPWHPQHLAARATEGYLMMVEAGTRPAPRWGIAAVGLVALAAFAWRASRSHA